jgi:hypothetical protein
MQIDSSTFALGLSVASWIALLSFIVKASMRFGALELKVDTMWGFQMRRSLSEVVATGFGKFESPLVIDEKVQRHLDKIKPRLIEWYANYAGRKSDASLLLGIEQNFGVDILNLVCLPCGLSYGACLIIALAVAKGDSNLNLHVGQDRR